MIILVLHEGAQRSVDNVNPNGFNLNRNIGKAVFIIDQKVDFSTFPIILVIEPIAVAMISLANVRS